MTSKKPAALKPDFSHRLSSLGDAASLLELADTVETMVFQATNSISLVQKFFQDNEDADMPSDDEVYWSLEQSINTIKDIQAVVAAYREAVEFLSSEKPDNKKPT